MTGPSRRGTPFAIVVLVAAFALSACASNEDPATGASDPHTPIVDVDLCPLSAPDDPTLFRVRVQVAPADSHQQDSQWMAPYEEGFAHVQWDHDVQYNRSLESSGCTLVEIPMNGTETFVGASVPDASPDCAWSRGSYVSVEGENRTAEVHLHLKRGCV